MFDVKNEKNECTVSNDQLNIYIFERPDGGVAIDVFDKKENTNKGWLILKKHKTKEVRFQERGLE